MSLTTCRLAFATLLCASSAFAAPAADAPLTAADRQQIVATLAQKLRTR